MYALNLTLSPENPILGVGRSFQSGRRPCRRCAKTSANCPPGVVDSIELHNGRYVTRRATIKGSWGNVQGKYHWETPGRGKKLPPKQRVQSGNRSQYLVNRIARDRPNILERIKAGEFATVRQAAIAAGIISVGGRSPSSRLRKPATATPAAQAQ